MVKLFSVSTYHYSAVVIEQCFCLVFIGKKLSQRSIDVEEPEKTMEDAPLGRLKPLPGTGTHVCVSLLFCWYAVFLSVW